MFFQKLDYKRAEPLFRRVITMPEGSVQDEVMLVSLHALRGILIVRKEYDEARQLELRAAAFEATHPNALARLKGETARGRKTELVPAEFQDFVHRALPVSLQIERDVVETERLEDVRERLRHLQG